MIRSFQIVCYLEGLSYILLLFIGVPLKYYGNNEILVKLLGMPHGILFVAYVVIFRAKHILCIHTELPYTIHV